MLTSNRSKQPGRGAPRHCTVLHGQLLNLLSRSTSALTASSCQLSPLSTATNTLNITKLQPHNKQTHTGDPNKYVARCGDNERRTFTDGVIVEVWFALVARQAVERRTTVTLAGLLITRHTVRARRVTVACYSHPQLRLHTSLSSHFAIFTQLSMA